VFGLLVFSWFVVGGFVYVCGLCLFGCCGLVVLVFGFGLG
jgi:hypothetical protein